MTSRNNRRLDFDFLKMNLKLFLLMPKFFQDSIISSSANSDPINAVATRKVIGSKYTHQNI